MGANEVEQLSDAEHRRKADLLQHDADPASRRGVARVAPAQDGPARVRAPETEQERDRGGLPRAVPSEQSQDLALAELEVDLLQGADPSERLADGLEAGDCR